MKGREGQSVIHLMVWIIILVSFSVCEHDEKVSLESLQLNSSAPMQSILIHSQRITDVAISIFTPSGMYRMPHQPYISSGYSSHSSQFKLIPEI